MGVKIYISSISGNKEIRKQQQRVMFVLSSLKIEFEIVDITEMGKESTREFMQDQCKIHDKQNSLPPQIFNDDTYCGNYDDFEAANEDNLLQTFLKIGEETKIAKDSNFSEETSNQQMLSNVETGESEALTA